jgi:DNA recombination protein RmuC
VAFTLIAIIGIALGALLGAAVALALARSGRERLRAELDRIAGSNRERLRDEMAAISADVLRQTGDSLSQRLVEQQRAEHERAAGEMARRAEEWKGLVRPVSEKLGKVESEIGRLERERRQAQGELAEMVRSMSAGTDTLRRETGNLVSALKGSSTRGSWGELHLRRVIEMAGMVEHCDFVVQRTIHTDEGRLRPDVLVHLPGDRLIVIDSKFPGSAFFRDFQSSGSPGAEEPDLTQHARQMREHIAKLSSKSYSSQFDTTPEVVVMFVPSDGNYLSALTCDPTLFEYGASRGVLIAAPTTLIGLLRSIDYGWRQERIAESARQIAEVGRELHKRLSIFAEPLVKLGRQLNSAVEAYNQASRSFDARLTPKVRELAELGARSDRDVASPASIPANAGAPRFQSEQTDAPTDDLLALSDAAVLARDERPLATDSTLAPNARRLPIG